ncbi:hypothetical protein LEP1GSC038_2386 [Leptospira weilii str. 2006001855]|uniref:Uncharacterized protein n=1 Tax=Leptospira weilii str. 2006001855 TaxID=996804 RepID=M6FMW2_9LEPT|nr:hypothetical protein LEP1GSC038_2386 [Leptospira weilii str. 2006001855]
MSCLFGVFYFQTGEILRRFYGYGMDSTFDLSFFNRGLFPSIRFLAL